MEGERVDDWIEAYRRAWERADTPAAVALFTTDARYHAHPLRPAHTGHDGAGAYWARATADQSDVRVRFRDPHLGRDGVLAYTRRAYATETGQDPRFGTPVASGASAAVEWWTTTLEEGRPATLIDTSILTFNAKGLVATGRDYWFLEPGAIPRSRAGAADHRREPPFRPAVAWPTAPASSQGPSRAAPEPGSRSG